MKIFTAYCFRNACHKNRQIFKDVYFVQMQFYIKLLRIEAIRHFYNGPLSTNVNKNNFTSIRAQYCIIKTI